MIDILVVEDNRELGSLLGDFLKERGYQVCLATSGEEALKVIEKQETKLVVLDVMLPGIDGLGILKMLRTKGNVPIIICSAKTEKNDKLNGILLGADDYIEKPYDIDILLAKIDGIFKRRYGTDMLVVGELRIDKVKRIAYKNDEPLSLRTKEFDLLLLLVENQGKVLEKDKIFDTIWGFDSESEPQTLTVHSRWLREKIEKDAKKPEHILTVWGIGYRFE